MIEGNTIVVPYMTESEADLVVGGKQVHVSAKTEYPYACRASYTLSGEIAGVTLAVYVPGKGLCRLVPDQNVCVTIDEQLHIIKEKAVVGEGEVLMLGDLMLGKAQDPAIYKNRVMRDGYRDLIPLCDCYLLEQGHVMTEKLQIVF
jgi:hypothetical protein